MEIKNALKPSHEQMENFNSGDLDTTIFMVNLLKFKEFACYEDGRETNHTGAEAYNIYSQEVQDRHLKKVGGKIIFSGAVSRLMLGEAEELWDIIAIAEYPNKKAMLEMITNNDYLESEKNRSAGLKGQLNIETKKL